MAQTGGADGWPWEEKPGRKGPPFSWLFVQGTSFCAVRLGPPSLGDGWRRDGCPRDGGRRPETDVPKTEVPEMEEGQDAEMDVPETEGVFFKHCGKL